MAQGRIAVRSYLGRGRRYLEALVKKLLLLIFMCAMAAFSARAQTILNPLTANLTAQSTDCSVANSCAWQLVTLSAGQSVVTLAGSFSGTFLVEQTNNGTTWTTAGTLTSTGTTTYNQNGFTAIRVRCSSYTSGTAAVTLSTGTGGGGSSGSGNGVGSGASPVLGFYLSPTCPAANTGSCFQTPANTVIDEGCSWATNSPTITCTGSHFLTTAAAGQFAWGALTCNPAVAQPVGGNITTTHNTILTVLTDTTLNLASNPANAAASGACFIHGTPDDTAAALVDTAMQNATQCPRLLLSNGAYMFTTMHFFTNPTACINLPSSYPNQATQGNLVLANGFEIEGRGPGATTWYLPPDFPETGSCVQGVLGDACWAVPLLGHWTGFTITGATNLSMPANKTLISLDIGNLDYFTCMNAGSSNAGTIGIEVTHWGQGEQVNVNSCGQTNMSINGGAGGANGNFYRLYLENGNATGNTPTNLLVTNGQMNCFGCEFLGTWSNVTPVTSVIVNNAGILNLYGGQFQTQTGTTPIGMRFTGSGGTVHLHDTLFANPNSRANWISFQNLASAGTPKLYLDNVILSHGSTGTSLNDAQSVMTYYIDNESVIDPTGWSITGGASVVADGHSLEGTCTGVANASVTNSLYGTGPNITTTTCASMTSTLGTGIPMTRAATLSSLFCKSTATTVSVACTIMVNGGASTLTCTMTAATACQDFAHTVAVVPGDLVSERIVTGAAETGANIKMFVLWQ